MTILLIPCGIESVIVSMNSYLYDLSISNEDNVTTNNEKILGLLFSTICKDYN